MNTHKINKFSPFILWVENFTDDSDFKQYNVNSFEEAKLKSTEIDKQVYRLTLKTEYGAIMATKSCF